MTHRAPYLNPIQKPANKPRRTYRNTKRKTNTFGERAQLTNDKKRQVASRVTPAELVNFYDIAVDNMDASRSLITDQSHGVLSYFEESFFE